MRTLTLLLVLLVCTSLASCDRDPADADTGRLAPQPYLEKLTFEDFTVKHQPQSFNVSGVIANHGDRMVTRIELVIWFVDPDGVLVGSWPCNVGALILPGRRYRVWQSGTFGNVSGRSAFLADTTIELRVSEVRTTDKLPEPVK